MDRLWQIRKRFRDTNRGWYEYEFVNGFIHEAMRLPIAHCPKCDSGMSSDRTLPFVCPPEIREEAEALEEEAKALREGFLSVELEKFRRYAKRWEAMLRRHGHDVILLPGDEFLPRLWRVYSIPRYDFFWPLPGDAPLVSERIARLLQDNQVSGISLRPVVLEKVGVAEPTDEVPVPKTGNMMDYFDEFPSLDDPSKCGNFFELLISRWTRPSPEDGVTIQACSVCGIEDWDESIAYKKQIALYRKKKILPRRYALDADVFRSHIFQLGFVVSPKGYALLSEEHLRNCRVDRLTVCDDAKAE